MSKEKYNNIVKHYENCLDKFGDTHKGVDWPNEEDALKRYKVMMDVIREQVDEILLLDFGCGAGHLLEYIEKKGIKNIKYSGLDLSEKFTELCRKKFPDQEFITADILENPGDVPASDYVIMNGVFTEKRELSYDEMFEYFKEMLRAIFPKVNKGLAFNVMSKIVDWERDDLFHLSFDAAGEFLARDLSRNFVIRNDYGLYEYTVYLYK